MNIKNENRSFTSDRAEKKLLALHLWKSGSQVTEISARLMCSRETIYRWLKDVENRLGSRAKRSRSLVDRATQWKIIEAYILLAKPSAATLSDALKNLYHLNFSPSQLRRWLKKWGLDSFRPSPLASTLLKMRESS